MSLNSHSNIDDKMMNKIIRKKVIWAEIKAKEQEYKRLQNQINDLKQAQADISFQVQKRMQESQEIAEYFDQLEFEALMKDKEGK